MNAKQHIILYTSRRIGENKNVTCVLNLASPWPDAHHNSRVDAHTDSPALFCH
jgi:hypothetical protein